MRGAALLLALAAAACTGDPPAPAPTSSPTPTLPPDEPLLLAALQRTEGLRRLYGTGTPPALRAHLAEQERAIVALMSSPPVPAVPTPRDVARPALVQRVRTVSREDTAAAGRAADPAVALLLARLGASRAQHAVVLGRR